MPDLADLVAAPQTGDVLPGYTLSVAGLVELATAEREFEKRYRIGAMADAAEMPEPGSTRLTEVAEALIARRYFCYGAPGFRANLFATQSIPFLLWLVLRPRHPKLTREQAAALIKPENETAVHRAVLECFGISFPERAATKPTADKPPTAPLTGPASSDVSAPSESDGERSAA